MSELSPLKELGAMDDAVAEGEAQTAEMENAASAFVDPGAAAIDVEVVDQFKDQWWRLNNLYYIVNEAGVSVKFVPNDMQRRFWNEMWYLNWIVKGRQHGFTTFIDIFMLDCCVFYPDQQAAIIALTLDDVKKIFRHKIKHPYNKLPAAIREHNPPMNDTQNELILKNGSEISVDTNVRGGTLNYLHVSEYGKIASVFPEKAVEIKLGSFNTVHPGNYIFVESTGHGKGGEFYEGAKTSRDMRRAGKELTQIDFKYHFYPWHENPKYCLSTHDADKVTLTRQNKEYFARVEKLTGKILTAEQKAWYVAKKRWNGDEMKREHPSHDDEPFEAVLKGAYFAEQMQEAREQGRITRVPHEPGLSVDTWWDLGLRDKMAIWFVQVVGREVRAIYYHEISDRSLEWHLKLLNDLAAERKFKYRHHIGPHDLSVRDLFTKKSRYDQALAAGFKFTPAPQFDQDDQIEAGRNLIPMMWFDEENCGVGISHLEQFRKEWNEHLGQYSDKWRHDEHSHGASALMTGAMMMGFLNTGGNSRARPVGKKRFAT